MLQLGTLTDTPAVPQAAVLRGGARPPRKTSIVKMKGKIAVATGADVAELAVFLAAFPRQRADGAAGHR